MDKKRTSIYQIDRGANYKKLAPAFHPTFWVDFATKKTTK